MLLGLIHWHCPLPYDVLKVVGIAYLLWMAWKIATSNSTIGSNDELKKPFTFLQAVLFQWVNPKAWVMVITLMGSFITSKEDAFLQVGVIAFTYLFIGLLSTNFWAYGGLYLQRFISNEKRVRIFNRVMAIFIVLSIMPFIF